MNNVPRKPGEIRIQKRVYQRQKFEPLKQIKIETPDDATAFVDLLVQKLPELQKVLARGRMQGVYANSAKAAAEKRGITPPIANGGSHDAAASIDIKEAAQNQQVTTEQRRLEQLRAAQQAIESPSMRPVTDEVTKKNPVQMPYIPGVTDGVRENPKPPAEAAVEFKKPEETESKNDVEPVRAESTVYPEPTGLPMTPDEETERSSTVTEEERKEMIRKKRAAALEKARAARKNKKNK